MLQTRTIGGAESRLYGDDLGDVVRGMRRQAGLIAASFLTVALATITFAFSSPPLYESQAIIIVDQEGGSILKADEIASLVVKSPYGIETQIELLKSRALMMRVLRAVDPDGTDFADELDSTPVGRITSIAGAAAVAAGLGEVFGLTATSDQNENERALEVHLNRLISNTTVERVGGTNMISIKFASVSAEKAARVANAIADQYIAEQIATQSDQLNRTIQWIEDLMGRMREEVRVAETAAAAFKRDNNIGVSIGSGPVADRNTTEVLAALAEEKVALANFSSRLEIVKSVRAMRLPLESLPEVAKSPIIVDLRRDQAQIERLAARALYEYGPDHPDRIRVEREREHIAFQIEQEIQRIADSVRTDMEASAAKVRMLERALSEITSASVDNSPAIAMLIELEGNIAASRDRYEALLRRQKEFYERERWVESNAKIVSRAEQPLAPSSQREKLLLAGLGGGFLLAGWLGFIADRSDTRVRNTRDLKTEFGSQAPVVLVPNPHKSLRGRGSDKEEIAQALVLDEPRSGFAQALHEIQSAAAASLPPVGDHPRSIAFVPTRTAEGAEAIAYGFAVMVAMAGKQVAFFDLGDNSLRLWNNRKVIDITSENPGAIGFADSDETPNSGALVSLSNAVSRLVAKVKPQRDLESPNTPSSQLVNFSSRELENNSFEGIVSAHMDEVDAIIICAPPILSSANVNPEIYSADGVFLIAEWMKTSRQEVRVAVDSLLNARANCIGVVVSGVDVSRREFFGPEDRRYFFR